MNPQDNDDDLKQPMIPPGDIGMIAIAAVFFLGFLYLMFGPNPFDALVRAAKTQQEPPSGTVTVTLPEKN